MIKIENVDVYGFEAAIRGMRNLKNSLSKSDSEYKYWCNCLGPDEQPHYCENCGYDACNPYIGDEEWVVGPNDLKLMQSLAKAGNDHGKFGRMINVTMDITAPLYWWKEFDTYKVGTVANSCSTMHKIAAKEFNLDDFSREKLILESINCLKHTIICLNFWRSRFNESDEARENYFNYNGYPNVPSKKDCWWQMIQLLPSSYNQKRTVQINYQVLWSMYQTRNTHKLDEWREFCAQIEALPYFKEIYLYDCSQNQDEKDS